MQLIRIALFFGLLAAPLNAQIIEDFESGNLAGYTVATSGANQSVVAAAAHDGSFGATFSSGNSGWLYRTDVNMAPDDKVKGFVRFASATSGRVYLGFSASAAGCWSAVAGPNTGVLELQENANFSFATRASVPFTYTANTWYLLEVDWASGGSVTLNLYDESGQNLLVSTGAFQGPSVAGGLAIRGFGSGSGNVDLDTVHEEGLNSNVICLGDGSGAICPCGNINDGSTGAGAGCANSHTSGGALMSGSGTSSLAAGDLVLSSIGAIPNTPGLYLQGDFAASGGLGTLLGDGLLCGGGNLLFMQVRFADSSGSSATTLNIGALGNLLPGDTRVYQLWYRDPQNSLCGSGSNLTNGLLVTWSL